MPSGAFYPTALPKTPRPTAGKAAATTRQVPYRIAKPAAPHPARLSIETIRAAAGKLTNIGHVGAIPRWKSANGLRLD